MFLRTCLLLLLMCSVLSESNAQFSAEKLPLIPMPLNIKMGDGFFTLNENVSIVPIEYSIQKDADIFNSYVQKMYGFSLKTKAQQLKKYQITLYVDRNLSPDAYKLTIDTNGVNIFGGRGAGVFYALQTLIQLIPAAKVSDLRIPFIAIDDSPRFAYRGMHLDVVRHFFSVDAVKKYIDHLAMYKMNYFHWHLTDDQGWRIEIKKYPKLTETGAWRKGTLIGHLGDLPEIYDSIRYGGFYTQDQIKDVIKYATDRHITIIPEIEMPGHAQAALAAYPEYSCTGGPFEVGRTWGVYKDVFCPKEETFTFLQSILDEVCTLFPGKYIHIGGDECPKDRWKECVRCQKLIKEKNLKDEEGLQAYFTDRIAKYLKTKNKIAIGWDEILNPDLDKDAVVMSWRGYNGGAEGAVKGHDVIMAPASHVYFDMYQSRNTGGRIAIGGYLPIDQVYRFEPVPDVLNTEQGKHILGAQGNVWTEYITNESSLEEMIFPRMAALADLLWIPKERRDYDAFTARLLGHFKLLGFQKLKYSTAMFDISTRVFPNGNNGVYIELMSHYPHGKIYYTLNGAEPTLSSDVFLDRIAVDQSVAIKAALFEGVQQRGTTFQQRYEVNKSTGKEVILANQPHVEYSRGGAFSLVDGVTGGLPWIPEEWLGFPGTNLDAIINLGKNDIVTRVNVDVLEDVEGKIFLPKSVKVLLSDNGKDFKEVASLDSTQIKSMKRKLKIQFPQTQAKYVKIVAENYNGKDWLFADEIGVE